MLLTAFGYGSSTMACNMLSYVEHYEPSYFLLENVFGFLAHKFYAEHETTGGTVETVIQAGAVTFSRAVIIAQSPQVISQLPHPVIIDPHSNHLPIHLSSDAIFYQYCVAFEE